jgi:hypothetical protein
MKRTRTGTAAEKIKRFPALCYLGNRVRYAIYNEGARSPNEMKRGEKVQVCKIRGSDLFTQVRFTFRSGGKTSQSEANRTKPNKRTPALLNSSCNCRAKSR